MSSRGSQIDNQRFKIVLLGDSGSGKTALLEYLKNNVFVEAATTVGVAFFRYKTSYGTIDIWDTAGQERFKSIVPRYFKGVHCVLFVVDITTNLAGVQFWNEVFDKESSIPKEKVLKITIGSKVDLTQKNPEARRVTQKDARTWCSTIGTNTQYFETSSVTGQNIHLVFETIGEKLMGLWPEMKGYKSTPLQSVDLDPMMQVEKKKCCLSGS